MANLFRNWTSLATPLSQMWHGVGETSAHPHLPFYARTTSWKKELVPKHLVISRVEFVAQVDVSITNKVSWCKWPISSVSVIYPEDFTLSAAADYHHPQPWPMRMVGGTTTSVDNSKHTELGPHNRCHQFLCEGLTIPTENQLIFRAEFQNSLLKNWLLHKIFTSTWIITNQAPMRSRPLSTLFLTPWSTTMKADKKVN